MNIVLGVLCMWIGGSLIWVAHNGIDSAGNGFFDIWQQVLSGIAGEHGGA